MVSFLQALGGFAPNFVTGLEQGAEYSDKRKKSQREDAIYSDEKLGQSALMKALMQPVQPQQPQMGPGQPSQPMQQPSAQMPQPQGGSPQGGAGGSMPMMQTIELIKQEAIKRGIDPNVALQVARSEGLGIYTGDQGSSFGPFQLHYGGVAQGGNKVGGLGDVFTQKTGLDARDPRTVPQQVGFALDQAKQGGWGPWHGWKGDPRAGLPGGPQGGQPPQQGGAPQQASQGGGGDWRQFAAKIMQANPNLTPGALLYALQAAQPFMNADSKAQVQALGLEMRERGLESRERMAGATLAERGREADQRATSAGAATTERGREADLRAETQTHIAQAKIEAAREALQDKHTMFDAREARLQKQHDDLTEQRKSATGEKAREFDIRLDMLKEQRQMLHEEKKDALAAAFERQSRGISAASERQEHGIGAASERQDKSLAARAEQFKEQQANINDRFAQRFKQAEEKIASAKTKEAKAAILTELRQAEQDRRAAMSNRVKAAAASMDTKELKALEVEEKQNRQDADQRIDELTKKARGDTPSTPAAAPRGKPLDDTVKKQMQEALQAGAPKESVIAKARELGYDISGF